MCYVCALPQESRHFTAASKITRNVTLTVTVMITDTSASPNSAVSSTAADASLVLSHRDRHHIPLLSATATTAFGTGKENL